MLVHRLLPLLVLATLAVGVIALPVLRMRARSGIWGVVLHRAPSPIHRFASVGLGLYAVCAVGWAVAYALIGPAGLGVWATGAWLQVAALALLASGLLLMMLAQRQMGASWRIGIELERTALVTTGLYARVRNPIYTALLLAAAGFAALTPSAWTLLGLLQAGLALGLQARLEEEHLLGVHGEEYRAYAARVGRFWPGMGRGCGPVVPAR
jgi:protein-S-isoprenylcysteine O-methyltransferase Ste14